MDLLFAGTAGSKEALVDVQQNARVPPGCRGLLVGRVLRGGSRTHVAAEFGISVKTASQSVSRFRAEGTVDLRDRTCWAQRCLTATVRELESAVLALCRQRLTLVST